MDRRRFLHTNALFAMASFVPQWSVSADYTGKVMTVQGPIDPQDMGITLTHEHVLVDFIGAEQVSKDRYDIDEAFEVILPHLQQAKRLGCQTMVECTPEYIGRDVTLLKRLSEATGMHILTNTGYYGAAEDKFIPAHAYDESVEYLVERWVNEWEKGIDDTGIRPGLIKTGVDSGKLSSIDAKLVRAAARTHFRTGLPIAAHTGGEGAILDELEILEEEEIGSQAFIWVHAQNDPQWHSKAAEQGVWISLDGVRSDVVDDYIEMLKALRQKGFLERVLLSHDAGWYTPGEEGGGHFRPYDTLFTELLPKMEEDFTENEIHQLMVSNPARAFTIGVRKGKTGF